MGSQSEGNTNEEARCKRRRVHVDVEDYMSDAVLGGEVQQQERSARPMKLRERMRLNRIAGLERPLSAYNKGYKLLLKMGWQGESLGDGRDRRTPIVAQGLMDIDRGRKGVGIIEAQQRAAAKLEEAKVQLESKREADFYAAKRHAATTSAVARIANRARHAVQDLDERRGIERHILWLGKEGEEKIDETSPHVQLRAALGYLLDIHCYSLAHGSYIDDESNHDDIGQLLVHSRLDSEVAQLLEDACDPS